MIVASYSPPLYAPPLCTCCLVLPLSPLDHAPSLAVKYPPSQFVPFGVYDGLVMQSSFASQHISTIRLLDSLTDRQLSVLTQLLTREQLLAVLELVI